jgi:hypothetical protein
LCLNTHSSRLFRSAASSSWTRFSAACRFLRSEINRAKGTRGSVLSAGRPKGARNKHSESFINAFAQDFEQHGAAVIEKVRKDRPQDYLKVAAALLPKQMEVKTAGTGSMSELSDAELMNILLHGSIDEIVEAVLVYRGHARLTSVQRQQLQQWEQEVDPGNSPQKVISGS